MRHNFEEVDDSLLANLHETTYSACTEHKQNYHVSDTNVQVSMGKPCSCVQLIKTCNFYYEYNSIILLSASSWTSHETQF